MHQHARRAALVTASVLVSLSGIAAAQDETTVSPVVVTATRTAQTADESLSSVTVITREEIEESQTTSLPDLLERQQGLSFARSGQFGKSSSLFMRGTNSDHVLVLVDGIKLSSATFGTTAFEHLPLEQIERIEIVRGPRSSLYGSEAIGGVIQIFTRSGTSGEPTGAITAMAGGRDTGELGATVSGGDADTRVTLSGKSFKTGGISAISSGFPDDDGYTNDSASMNVAQDLGERATLSLRAVTANGVTETDLCGTGSQDCETEFTQQALSSRLETRFTSAWSAILIAGQSRDESTGLVNGSFDNEFDTKRDEVSWQNDITIGSRNLLTLGLDYRDEQVESSQDFTRTGRSNKAAFAQWQWTGERADFQTSARHDDNEAFGEANTGSISTGYRLGRATRVYGSLGTAFKAPTFNDLFFPFTDFGGGFTFEGNPDLDPEESESVEIGLEGGHRFHWSINAYHTEIDNIIVLNDSASSVVNLDKGSINGLELTGGTSVREWDIRANFTLLDATQETDDANDGNELPRRPQQVFAFDFRRTFGRYSFGGHAQYESARYDDAANTTELDEFTVIDLDMEYELARDLKVRGSVQNVFDEDYQTVATFNTLGRTLFVRLDYRPQ